MKLGDFKKLVEKSFDCIENEVLRHTAREGSWQLFEEEQMPDAFEENLPQSNVKVAVVLENPKTAALFFDHVCHIREPYSIPSDIRIKAPTSIYLYDLFICSIVEASDALEGLTETDCPNLPRKELAKHIFRAAIMLVDKIVPGFARATAGNPTLTQFPDILFKRLLWLHSYALWHEYRVDAVPLYGSYTSFEDAYQEGDKPFLIASFSNLGIIDEQRLEWEQVKQLRDDKKSIEGIRRVIHWFDSSLVGKSRQFIEDDINIKLNDFAYSLKKHGIKTVQGTISAVLDGKFMLGSTAASVGLAWLAKDPVFGLLSEGLFLSSKILVHISEKLLDIEGFRKGPGSELAFVQDLKRRYGEKAS